MGIVLVAFLAAHYHPGPSRYHEDIKPDTTNFGRKLTIPILLPLPISIFSGDVLSFYVAKIAQTEANCLETGGVGGWIQTPIDTPY